MAKCLSQNTKVTVEDASKNIQVYRVNGQNLENLFCFFSSFLNASHLFEWHTES